MIDIHMLDFMGMQKQQQLLHSKWVEEGNRQSEYSEEANKGTDTCYKTLLNWYGQTNTTVLIDSRKGKRGGRKSAVEDAYRHLIMTVI